MSDPKFSDYVYKRLEEKEVVELIIGSKDSNGEYDLQNLHNVIYPRHRYGKYERYTKLFIATNIERTELKLPRDGKPGDIDILVIPVLEGEVCFERTATFEVKVVRATLKNMNRDANSQGTKQIYGLIEDGFPLIGLIHVCMSEPLPVDRMMKVNENNKTLPNNNKGNAIALEEHHWDWLPGEVCDNQMRRLISSGLPKYVGINAFALAYHSDGSRSTVWSTIYQGFSEGYYNPQAKKETVLLVKNHFEKYGKDRYLEVQEV